MVRARVKRLGFGLGLEILSCIIHIFGIMFFGKIYFRYNFQ